MLITDSVYDIESERYKYVETLTRSVGIGNQRLFL